MKFEKLTPNQEVYEVSKRKMGNTSITTVAIFTVKIISVDPIKRTVEASWNNNSPKTYYENSYKHWKEKKPMLVKMAFGNYRLATREEIKSSKGD